MKKALIASKRIFLDNPFDILHEREDDNRDIDTHGNNDKSNDRQTKGKEVSIESRIFKILMSHNC